MKLHEYQAKELLARFGVPVPAGEVATNAEEALRIARSLGGKTVVKAQVLMGGRGKAGGVRLFDNAEEAAHFAGELIGKRLVSPQNPTGMVVEKVLVVTQVDIAAEFYVAVLLDRAKQCSTLMLSAAGGMEIEEVAATNPSAIVRVPIDPAWGVADFQLRDAVRRAKIPTRAQSPLVALMKRLVKAAAEVDADLVEVNPCALTPDGSIVAADAKVVIDDNALFRHPEYSSTADASAEDPIEAQATRQGIAYVRLGGDIGVIGNGAGLVMCSLDEVSAAGGRPANFLDVGGGAQAERVKECVGLVMLDPNVKGLLINIFGGITRCDEVARGLLQAFDELNVRIPVVARIEGTAAEEGRKLLEGSRLVAAETMQEAARKIVELAYA
ncbi:MAG: ADP-forming succinate--CoA ligase subunit beta [Fimbriimonas ginsengisoli]|uniref:Succinate--CoA ligase [ADP-forming] subunit beta n=1 Tax=Fimbriimonas ginsengisoli TaxID=1005039 RepID=A0A931LRM5_FIMGI|nr:ADP-forming succinate--CoA ligase subunit beta [Fimbriimonas ginsengisoli]